MIHSLSCLNLSLIEQRKFAVTKHVNILNAPLGRGKSCQGKLYGSRKAMMPMLAASHVMIVIAMSVQKTRAFVKNRSQVVDLMPRDKQCPALQKIVLLAVMMATAVSHVQMASILMKLRALAPDVSLTLARLAARISNIRSLARLDIVWIYSLVLVRLAKCLVAKLAAPILKNAIPVSLASIWMKPAVNAFLVMWQVATLAVQNLTRVCATSASLAYSSAVMVQVVQLAGRIIARPARSMQASVMHAGMVSTLMHMVSVSLALPRVSVRLAPKTLRNVILVRMVRSFIGTKGSVKIAQLQTVRLAISICQSVIRVHQVSKVMQHLEHALPPNLFLVTMGNVLAFLGLTLLHVWVNVVRRFIGLDATILIWVLVSRVVMKPSWLNQSARRTSLLMCNEVIRIVDVRFPMRRYHCFEKVNHLIATKLQRLLVQLLPLEVKSSSQRRVGRRQQRCPPQPSGIRGGGDEAPPNQQFQRQHHVTSLRRPPRHPLLKPIRRLHQQQHHRLMSPPRLSHLHLCSVEA